MCHTGTQTDGKSLHGLIAGGGTVLTKSQTNVLVFPEALASMCMLNITVFVWRATVEKETERETGSDQTRLGKDAKKRAKERKRDIVPTNQLLRSIRQGYLRLNASSRNSFLVLCAGSD